LVVVTLVAVPWGNIVVVVAMAMAMVTVTVLVRWDRILLAALTVVVR
jgi:hypothetical protein